MRENSPLGRIAFYAVTALALLWAAGGLIGMFVGLIAQPWTLVPLLIVLGPTALVIVAVVVDRLRSPEDSYYSRNVND